MIDDIIDKLNDLSRDTIDITVRLVQANDVERQPLCEEAIPDIMVAQGFFDIYYDARVPIGYV
jgi:hypothetical protein